jgi:hypothetical protein
VDFQPGLRPDISYDGPGVYRSLAITEEDVGTFQFSFSAMSLPDGLAWELNGVNDLPEYRVFDFFGSLSCCNGLCRLKGELHSREYGKLVVVGAGEEVRLHPGVNHVALEWSHSQQ